MPITTRHDVPRGGLSGDSFHQLEDNKRRATLRRLRGCLRCRRGLRGPQVSQGEPLDEGRQPAVGDQQPDKHRQERVRTKCALQPTENCQANAMVSQSLDADADASITIHGLLSADAGLHDVQRLCLSGPHPGAGPRILPVWLAETNRHRHHGALPLTHSTIFSYPIIFFKQFTIQ